MITVESRIECWTIIGWYSAGCPKTEATEGTEQAPELLAVRSTRNAPDQVVLEVRGVAFVVSAADLIAALENARNTGVE